MLHEWNNRAMKDQNGIYYHPNPADVSTRVYVRRGQNGPQFRLWHNAYPEVWEKHGWLELDLIKAAAGIYKPQKVETDPLRLYDEAVAIALLKQDTGKN